MLDNLFVDHLHAVGPFGEACNRTGPLIGNLLLKTMAVSMPMKWRPIDLD